MGKAKRNKDFERKMKTEELGICTRCKKNKATLQYAEGTMAVVHDFVENICQECFDKQQKASPLWKKATEERNVEVEQAIEECKMDEIIIGPLTGRKVIDYIELLQKLGLGK